MLYDVIVIGAGTSGLMAAIAASQQHATVLLLEKNSQPGKKLLLTGGGRCNVTNNRSAQEVIAHIPGNGKFLYSAFSQFDNLSIIDFFQKNGVALKEEDHGRMFPTTDKARTILDALLHLLEKESVTLKTNQTVTSVQLTDDLHHEIKTETHTFLSKSVIIAVGGKSIPKTGSTGDGYAFAKEMGHTITPLFPTEVPITSSEPFIKEKTLQGISLRNVSLSVLNQKNKPSVTHTMDMIFTHFGISGPAVLRCSSFVYKEQQKQQTKNITMLLDCVPHISKQALHTLLQNNLEKSAKNILKTLIPERLALFFINKLACSEQILLKQLSSEKKEHLIHLLKNFTFTVDGSLPIEKSFVTGGGVKISEIIPQTMMSKKRNGVFFCGEILDIHGYTGGYNITSAFVTGHIAGNSASNYALGYNSN